MKTFFIQVQIYFLIAFLFIFSFLGSAYAQTVFDGTTQDGQVIGECLNPEGKPQCSDVACGNPQFAEDPRCQSEAQAGSDLAGQSISTTGIPTGDSVSDLIIKFVNFALPYLALGAFLAFVVAAFLYVANFGNEEITQKAKNIMIWAIVGLLIVIASYAIVQFFTVGLLGRL